MDTAVQSHNIGTTACLYRNLKAHRHCRIHQLCLGSRLLVQRCDFSRYFGRIRIIGSVEFYLRYVSLLRARNLEITVFAMIHHCGSWNLCPLTHRRAGYRRGNLCPVFRIPVSLVIGTIHNGTIQAGCMVRSGGPGIEHHFRQGYRHSLSVINRVIIANRILQVAEGIYTFVKQERRTLLGCQIPVPGAIGCRQFLRHQGRIYIDIRIH